MKIEESSVRRAWLLTVLLVPALWWGTGRPCAAQDHEHPRADEAAHTPPAAEHSTASPEHPADGHAAGGHGKPDPLGHVIDIYGQWHLFDTFGPTIPLPEFHFGKYTFRVSKYMVLELLAGVLIAAIYIPLSKRVRNGDPPRGGWLNAFESLLTFIRDEVARPNIGHHADRYVPFLWTLFLFVLFNNLLGMFPFLGSATASIWVTGGLAVCSLFAIHGGGIAEMGLVPYLKSLWPHLDIPVPVVGFLIKLLIFVIEFLGVFIKAGVLAVRLFANMLAGHAVLAMIMLFIVMASNASPLLWGTVTVASVLGVVALSLLELFVAFLQAYIFTFLTALFMGMSMHPAH